jgi:hypothetical protein
MRDASEISPAEEAQELLENFLTEDEATEAHELYKDVNERVRWGNVLDEAYSVLLEIVGELVDNPSMGKDGLPPWSAISEEDRLLFEGDDPKAMARQHSMILGLAKKLLGGLKTRVVQSRKSIRVLSLKEEDHLMEIAEEREEEEPLILKGNIKVSPVARGNCKHARTTISTKAKSDCLLMRTYCHDCHTVVEVKSLQTQRPTGKCEHSQATWVEGREGQEAICSNPRCAASIEDPSIYRWDARGLEPPGDDPTNDEVITLCSDYS